MQVNTHTRVRVSLSAETTTDSHAAWATLLSQDRAGILSPDILVSTRGLTEASVSVNSSIDNSSAISDGAPANGSAAQNIPDMFGDTEVVAGNFSSSTAWLGQSAARQSQQLKWYYVSSVITGTVNETDFGPEAHGPGAPRYLDTCLCYTVIV